MDHEAVDVARFILIAASWLRASGRLDTIAGLVEMAAHLLSTPPLAHEPTSPPTAQC